MKRVHASLAGAVACACAGTASAGFTGWSWDIILVAPQSWIVNVYANFNDQGDRLLNCLNSTITTAVPGGFYQSAENPFWSPSSTQNKNTSFDSWMTIDTNPNGSGNAYGGTIGDPNFVNFADYSGTTTYDFSVVESVGTGAGWYNSTPFNSYGFADGGKVLTGHLAFFSASQPPVFANWDVSLIVKLSNGSTVTYDPGNVLIWSPAPSALAVLAIAGLRQRRARQR